MGVIFMMVLKIHIRKSFQQLLPVILTFLPVALVFGSSFFHVSSASQSSFAVSSFFFCSAAFFKQTFIVSFFFRPSVISVFLRKLWLVVSFCLWTEVIMQLFLNGLLRRKPPLYGIKNSSWRTSGRGVFFFSGGPISFYVPHPVIIESYGGRSKPGRRRMGLCIHIFFLIVLIFFIFMVPF